ncbi:MAG: class I SAM-dependent methyltransferase [Actinomycetota bacterium]
MSAGVPEHDGPNHDGPKPDGRAHWFEALADHMGPAYLRYSFTKGTGREIDELLRRVPLGAGARILDVGCGPGRHAHELGRRGFTVHGVDISETFVEVARENAPSGVTFERLDARSMTFEGDFDLVLSVCQGAFGMSGGPAAGDALDPDADILAGMARAVRAGGRVVFTAFNAYLQVANMVEGNDFDAERGVHREATEVRDGGGAVAEVDLWTTCFTPRELRLLCDSVGLTVESIDAAKPGDWTLRPPDTDSPEFLVIASR